jgi:hypothetical protein
LINNFHSKPSLSNLPLSLSNFHQQQADVSPVVTVTILWRVFIVNFNEISHLVSSGLPSQSKFFFLSFVAIKVEVATFYEM